MFLSSFDSGFDSGFDSDAPVAGDILAEIGVDRHTVREVVAEDRALRCSDREAAFPERRIADLYTASAFPPAQRRWRRA